MPLKEKQQPDGIDRITSVSEMIRKPPLVEVQNAVGKQKNTAKKRFSIWRLFAILNFRGLHMGSFKIKKPM